MARRNSKTLLLAGVAGVLALTPGRVFAQSEAAPSFEVASVKRHVGPSGIELQTTPTMQRLIGVLADGAKVTQLIVDETGLEGGYDFTLDVFKYKDYAVERDLVPVFARALQDVGLKLEPQRRRMEVLVIDHAEKTPIEN